jgi:P2-related tail formation protein
VNWEYTWTEGKGSLVKQFDDIVAYLLDRAVTLTLEVEEADRQADEERKRWEAERAIAISRHERSLIIQAREDSLKNLLRIIETWSHDRKTQEFFDEIAARSVSLNNEDRSQLLAKIHEAKNLLACADSVDALMSWVTPPQKPAE